MIGWIWVVVAALLPLIFAAVPMLSLGLLWQRRLAGEPRRNPLTRSLLRSPGHSLRIHIDDLSDEVDSHIVALAVLPFLIGNFHLAQSLFIGTPESAIRVLVEVAVMAGLIYTVWRQLRPKLEELRHRRLGLEGELATGQELDQLMLSGCRVYHDVPFQYGNVDHVVISRSGVFTIETKMRGKPIEGDAFNEVVVDYEQNVIRFPDFVWRIPVAQPETQANWLSKHLSAAMGERIEVEPILALPGWFIRERIGRGRPLVLNPLNAQKFFVNSRELLSEQRVSQLAHHMELLCRDVKPTYKERE